MQNVKTGYVGIYAKTVRVLTLSTLPEDYKELQMTIEAAALLGVWAFAVATAMSKQVSGEAMVIAWLFAIGLTLYLL